MSPNVATLILILHYDAMRFLVRLCTTRSPCHLGCLGRWFRVVLIQCLGVICSLPACFVQPFWFDRAVHAQWKIELVLYLIYVSKFCKKTFKNRPITFSIVGPGNRLACQKEINRSPMSNYLHSP